MCVIIGGLKKNLKREEQIAGMRANTSGFATTVIRPNGTRTSVRSLKESDVMDLWDKAKPEDYIVTHSRIPSHGGMTANLADVHGWEREGVIFFHNGTMTNVISVMPKTDGRTDSLYFFEEIFIPLWKSQGRKFNPLVERIIEVVTRGSRVCFILPNGEVRYYGEFVQEHECMFSNTHFKSYLSSSQAYPACGGFGRGSFRGGCSSEEEDYERWWAYGGYGATYGGKPVEQVTCSASQVTEAGEDDTGGVPEVLPTVGVEVVAKMFLERLAILNVKDTWLDEASNGNANTFRELQERFDSESYTLLDKSDSFILGNFDLEKRVMTGDEIGDILKKFAESVDEDFFNEDIYMGDISLSDEELKAGLITRVFQYFDDNKVESRLINLFLDWDHVGNITGLAKAWKMVVDNVTGVPTMEPRSLTDIWSLSIGGADKKNNGSNANLFANLSVIRRLADGAKLKLAKLREEHKK